AMVQLHPQSAVEALTTRFRAGGGTGSDGALVIEAAEIAVTRGGVVPVPVRPAEPLAGAPDRSPIPLADSVVGGIAAAQSGARRARVATGGVLYRLLGRVQDALPNRAAPNRRVTPMSARREMQRRAAMALLSLVVVVGGLGAAVFFLGGRQPTGPTIASLNAAQGAVDLAQANLKRVIGPGVDLVVNDPERAEELLSAAYTALETAERGNVPLSTINPIRSQVVAALDRLYGMIDVASSPVFTFPDKPAVDLRTMVQGPDGAPFVLDAATQSVYRIDIPGKKATVIFREGNKAAGSTQWAPKLLAVGGRDLLMLDTRNVMWRWQPANATGKGTITRVRVQGASEWGDDILGIGTFLRNRDDNLYNLYVVDPSAQQILRYSPAADGGGFPNVPNLYLNAARDVGGISSVYIDGDVWLADGGEILRLVSGNSAGWSASLPGDAVLRDDPVYRLISSGAERRTGTMYGYDPTSDRVVALSKVNGTFLAQYRLYGGATGWSDIRGWYVEPGLEQEPDTLVWMGPKGIFRSVLQPTSGVPNASEGPPSPDASK
ncbi:MAG TPA: hypothetical protein VIF63_03890, partial [Candidatus Limnocylindrales bacterium]